jgi:hypothetical protein
MKMKMKCFAVIFLIFCVFQMHGIEIEYSFSSRTGGEGPSIKLTDRVLELSDGGPTEKYDVTWEIVNGLSFIRFNYTGRFLGSAAKGAKRYLVLYRDGQVLFYNSKNELEYSFPPFGYLEGSAITATSELREGNRVYGASGLPNLTILSPWADGVSGNGIGQKIRIQGSRTIRGFVIINGYIDYNKPHLFEQNNRVKRIRVYTGQSYRDIELQDSPRIQVIELDTGAQNIEIEILEIYRGSKYDDTCLTAVVPVLVPVPEDEY